MLPVCYNSVTAFTITHGLKPMSFSKTRWLILFCTLSHYSLLSTGLLTFLPETSFFSIAKSPEHTLDHHQVERYSWAWKCSFPYICPWWLWAPASDRGHRELRLRHLSSCISRRQDARQKPGTFLVIPSSSSLMSSQPPGLAYGTTVFKIVFKSLPFSLPFFFPHKTVITSLPNLWVFPTWSPHVQLFSTPSHTPAVTCWQLPEQLSQCK